MVKELTENSIPDNKYSSKGINYILSRKIGTLLSSYTRAINIQENKTGSLFQQKTKALEISAIHEYDDKSDYLTACFHYIHQNPIRGRLVNKIEDWEFSSFNDYAGIRDETLINLPLAKQILEVDWDNFYEESYQVIDENFIQTIK